jgi:hypothetical protein
MIKVFISLKKSGKEILALAARIQGRNPACVE